MEPQRAVLIVDDDDTLRATLKKIFAKAGYQAESAKNAAEAAKIVSEHEVDLVLLDLKMPRKDGLTLLDEIREMRPGTKVIIMTAYGTEETHQDAMQKGAYAYLNKPVSRAQLLQLCEAALKNS